MSGHIRSGSFTKTLKRIAFAFLLGIFIAYGSSFTSHASETPEALPQDATTSQSHGEAETQVPASGLQQLDAPGHVAPQLHTETAEHHKTKGLPQLDPSTYETQAFWLVIIFATLYFIYSKISLPEISKVVEGRKDRVQNDLDTAEKLRAEAQSIRNTYENDLLVAREKASDAFKKAENSIKTKTEKKTQAFLEDSQKQIEDMEKAILSAKSAAMTNIDDVAAELAIKAAEKIIGVKVNPTEAKTLISSMQKTAKAA